MSFIRVHAETGHEFLINTDWIIGVERNGEGEHENGCVLNMALQATPSLYMTEIVTESYERICELLSVSDSAQGSRE